MAYCKPRNMDEFATLVARGGDTRFRQMLGADLVAYLSDPDNPIECEDIGAVIDPLVSWLQNSNFKVSQNGLEVITFICDRLKHDFWPFVPTILPHVIDRLGDQKDTVREKAQLLILKLVERHVMQPQQLFDKLSDGFTHKNNKIREEVLRCLVNVLNEYGVQHITLNKLVPSISKLLSDPTPSVRDTAFNTLVEIYKHVGEKLRVDIQKRNCIPPTKLPGLLARFSEVKANGELLPTATTYANDYDEPDRVMIKPTKPVKRTVSASSTIKKSSLMSTPGQAGAVDEAHFLKSYEDVPTVQIFSVREVNDQMRDIKDALSDTNKTWTKRVDALKKIRSLIIAGATSYEDFLPLVRALEPALELAVTDLRSQVVREACVTIAYLSQTLGNRFEIVARGLLPVLIHLIQNSAKVVATAGTISLQQVLTYTQCPKLIPIIGQHATTSKSREIRKACCTLLSLILRTWSPTALERQLSVISDTLKKGIVDADSDARQISRRSYWVFKEHFPDAADALLKLLEPSYQRAVLGAASASGEHMSSSSSSSSLNQVSTITSSAASSHYSARSTTNSADPSPGRSAGMRSYTSIDLQAAQRAKARTQYAAMARQKIASGTASLQGEVAQEARPRKVKQSPVASNTERTGRTRSRPLGGSISQPTSRSVSPSLRLSYATYGKFAQSEVESSTPRTRKLSSSGIPRSTSVSRDQSRETSPSRARHLVGYGSGMTIRGSPASSLRSTPARDHHRPPISPHRPPVMAQKILQQSREAESALAAALTSEPLDSMDFAKTIGGRRINRSLDNPSDDSEASSVCSERSYDSYRRPSDSYSLSGSHTRLSRDHWEHREISEIIELCASRTWTERKEGLLGLYSYFNDGNMLSKSQLEKVTEIFFKMFMDPNTKVVSLFLDTLNELILTHNNDLHDWLYMLLQRIFVKLGGEILGSIYKKIEKTLDVIRGSFPVDLQMHSVFRYLTDVTQRPNAKVKRTILVYIIHLTEMNDSFVSDDKELVANAVEKIISFTEDKKSSADIQTVAHNCLISLLNCNTPQLMNILSSLPIEKQNVASEIIRSLNLRKSSVGSSPTKSPLGPDGFSREDIHRSLRHTTAEIQNYSFEAPGPGSPTTKLERDSTSQDSGISQMSVGGGSRNNGGATVIGPGSPIADDLIGIESRFTAMKINSPSSARPGRHLDDDGGPVSLPANARFGNGDSITSNGNELDVSESEIVKRVTEFDSVSISRTEKKNLLTKLAALIKSGRTTSAVENFKILLRILLNHLEGDDESIQKEVLIVLTEIFRSDSMKDCVIKFLELLTLKILNVHASPNKDVVRLAERTAAAMTKCPLDGIMHVLNPVIVTDVSEKIEGAIKMLTRMIEVNGATQLNAELLQRIVPQLIIAYDHSESTVRKSAVFCMVAIHSAVGEEALKPHLNKLTGSKLKLLHLYIQRAQQKASSVPASPKNSSSVSTVPPPPS